MKRFIVVYLMLCLVAPIAIMAEKQSWPNSGLYWDFSNNILTISGYGSMPSQGVPWAFKGYNIEKIIIENGVTSIRERLFMNDNNIKSVVIGLSVKSIGNDAFSGCGNLTSVSIPNSVSYIGSHAFSSCESLTTITLPDSLTSISNGTFSNCYSLSSVQIPNSVTNIGEGAFAYCKNLSSVTIPSSVKTIASNAFSKGISGGSITLLQHVDLNNSNYIIVTEEITTPLDGGLVSISKNYGFKKITGEWIIPLGTSYSEIFPLANVFLKVKNRKLYGAIDTDGKVIIPCEMEALEAAGVGFLRFKLNGFYGIVNYAGKIIIPTDRGYTKIGDYVSFTKRFAYEMDGWKGECNNLGVQVSKIKVNKPVAQQTQTTTEKVVPNNPQKKDTIIIKHDPVPMQVWKKCDVCFGSGICQACVNIVWGQGSDRRCYGCGWSRKCQFCAGQGGHYEVEYR